MKTKVLISCVVTAQLFYAFVFAFAKSRFSRDTAHLSRDTRKPTFWFPNWFDTNWAVQLQTMARGLKFRIKKVEGSYYLCSENKGADQLRGYREADLRLCFRKCKMLVFS